MDRTTGKKSDAFFEAPCPKQFRLGAALGPSVRHLKPTLGKPAQLAGIAYSFDDVTATSWSDQPEGRKGPRRK